MMKKNIAKLLVFAMLLSMLPFAAAAAETEATAASVSISDYVTISDVEVGGTALAATSADGTYTFSTDTAVTLGDGNKVTVTFGVAGKNSATIYSVSRDTANLYANGSVSDEITVEDAAQAQNLTYTVTTKNPDKSASFKVTFNVADSTVAVESVTVEPKTLSLKVGGSGELTATVLPENATDTTVTWTTSNEEIATVDVKGVVTAKAAGEATITATAGDKTGICKVTVEEAAIDDVKAPEVTAEAEIPEGASENVSEIINAAATAVTENAASIAPDLSNAILNTTTKDSNGNLTITGGAQVDNSKINAAETRLKEKENVSQDATIRTVIVPKLEIKVSNATEENGIVVTLTFTIQASAVVKVTTAENASDMTDANSEPVDEVSLADTDEEITITLPLPTNFQIPEQPAVRHVKSNGTTFLHMATKGENSISFVNNRGFSEFTIVDAAGFEAVIGGEYYETLSSAIDAVAEKGTITVLKNGLHATVSKEVTFKLGDNVTELNITAGSGYTKTTSEDGRTITITKSTGGNTSSGGGGGGGGGGSSKPAIKPGDKPTTPGTTAPSGGVAGFNDVAPGAWYADSVKYVVEKGLFGGVGNGNFAPNANMTRAMMWTVLARYMGVNTNTGSNWYEAARAWAIEKGISDGTMADGNVTREQFVTMLWRLSGEPTVDNGASFTDSGKVSGYAKTAVDWAVAQGIVNGYSDGTFKPQGSATRAEVAKMLTVFCQ